MKKLNPQDIEANVAYTDNLPALDIKYQTKPLETDLFETGHKRHVYGIFSFTYPRWDLKVEYCWYIKVMNLSDIKNINPIIPDGEYYVMRTSEPDMYILSAKIATAWDKRDAEATITIKNNKMIELISSINLYNTTDLQRMLRFERALSDESAPTGTSY